MDTPTRSIAKALSWQALGLVTMTLIALAFTGDWSSASGVALASAGTGAVFFFIHERVWSAVRWGRRERSADAPADRNGMTVC
jgi:uncharacterized membrane protein